MSLLVAIMAFHIGQITSRASGRGSRGMFGLVQGGLHFVKAFLDFSELYGETRGNSSFLGRKRRPALSKVKGIKLGIQMVQNGGPCMRAGVSIKIVLDFGDFQIKSLHGCSVKTLRHQHGKISSDMRGSQANNLGAHVMNLARTLLHMTTSHGSELSRARQI